MSETKNHPWCRDVPRDEAVRAAEDAAAAERTPVPDHRDLPAAVAELRERAARLEAAIYRAGQFAAAEAQKGPNFTERASGLLDRLTAERDAAIRERDAAREECGRLRHLLKTKESECETHHPWVHPSAAPAANAGGVSNPEPISGAGKSNRQGNLDGSQEPVAWGVLIDSGRGLYGHYDFEAEARGVCDAVNAEEGWSMTVVPLYAAPPEPRGWLTAREREEVQWAADAAYDKQHPAEDTLRGLLARSTPPKVKVPSQPAEFTLPRWNLCISRWIAAIRAAGGEVEG